MPSARGFAGPRAGSQFIRQIAALPYRTDGTAVDAPVRVLLITSRENKRWVIPKGNPTSGIDGATPPPRWRPTRKPGVRGLVCPTPLGSYRYRKRQRNGASLMVDVDVFPLAVNRELDHWKEQAERERRWVSASTTPPKWSRKPTSRTSSGRSAPTEFKAATKRLGVIAATQSRISPMFAWFQRLLPKQGNFFDHVRSACGGRSSAPPTLWPGWCSDDRAMPPTISAK